MARVRFAILALVVAAAPLAAQQAPAASVQESLIPVAATPGTPHMAAAPSAVGPRMDALSAAARSPASAAELTTMAATQSLGQAKAMMIVGGAALLAGAVIGGDGGTIVMIGGAVIGLVGLYEYLK